MTTIMRDKEKIFSIESESGLKTTFTEESALGCKSEKSWDFNIRPLSSDAILAENGSVGYFVSMADSHKGRYVEIDKNIETVASLYKGGEMIEEIEVNGGDIYFPNKNKKYDFKEIGFWDLVALAKMEEIGLSPSTKNEGNGIIYYHNDFNKAGAVGRIIIKCDLKKEIIENAVLCPLGVYRTNSISDEFMLKYGVQNLKQIDRELDAKLQQLSNSYTNKVKISFGLSKNDILNISSLESMAIMKWLKR